jgi:hypothetical protein
MNSSKELAAIVALAVSAGLAGTGCMAQSADENEGQDEMAAPADQKADGNEKIGEATQKCGWGGGFGFSGFGVRSPIDFPFGFNPGWGCGGPIGGWGGLGPWGASWGTCW